MMVNIVTFVDFRRSTAPPLGSTHGRYVTQIHWTCSINSKNNDLSMQLCNSSLHIHGQRRGVLNYCRGVTRLDGARGKKQIWRPHVRTWGLLEANVLHWSISDIVRSFRLPPQSFGAFIAIWRPGNCATCPRRCAPDNCAQRCASANHSTQL